MNTSPNESVTKGCRGPECCASETAEAVSGAAKRESVFAVRETITDSTDIRALVR